MKKIFLVLLATLIVLPFASDACAKDKKKKKKKGETELVVSAPKKLSAYEKLFKGKNVVTAKSDFITLHKVENKLYFEIPLKYMNRDFLLASTVTKVTSPEFCDIGYKADAFKIHKAGQYDIFAASDCFRDDGQSAKGHE